MKEYFRGVIWPRGKAKDKRKINYRYIVVGMLVTDEPIDNIEGVLNAEGISQNFLDGTIIGMADAISNVTQRETNYMVGDANHVLTDLEHL